MLKPDDFFICDKNIGLNENLLYPQKFIDHILAPVEPINTSLFRKSIFEDIV